MSEFKVGGLYVSRGGLMAMCVAFSGSYRFYYNDGEYYWATGDGAITDKAHPYDIVGPWIDPRVKELESELDRARAKISSLEDELAEAVNTAKANEGRKAGQAQYVDLLHEQLNNARNELAKAREPDREHAADVRAMAAAIRGDTNPGTTPELVVRLAREYADLMAAERAKPRCAHDSGPNDKTVQDDTVQLRREDFTAEQAKPHHTVDANDKADEWSPWTDWSGGECPVHPDQDTEAEHRGGVVTRGKASYVTNDRGWHHAAPEKGKNHRDPRWDIIRYRCKLPLLPVPEQWSPWQDWHRGKCPVHHEQVVEVRRIGYVSTLTCQAGELNWNPGPDPSGGSDHQGEITSYRYRLPMLSVDPYAGWTEEDAAVVIAHQLREIGFRKYGMNVDDAAKKLGVTSDAFMIYLKTPGMAGQLTLLRSSSKVFKKVKP